MFLVTSEEMQQIDRQTIESFGLPGRVLMENAGRGATQIFFDSFHDILNKKIGVVAGRGNNGGDGFVIARYLFQKQIKVTVYLLSEKNLVKGDAASNLDLLDVLGVEVIEMPDLDSFEKHKNSMLSKDIWIDAILGTGLKSDVKGYFKDVITFINSLKKSVFAVDMPSGLNSDTGQICGICMQADTTATFAFPKNGHFLYPGADYTGNLKVVDIGIPQYIVAQVEPLQYLLKAEWICSFFHKRPADIHKGDTGHLIAVAGSVGKTGAAVMTAISAMRAGAGLVTLAVPESINHVLETQVIEAMTHPLPETNGGMLDESSFDMIIDLLKGKKCLAIGPGLGTAPGTKMLVQKIVKESLLPVVIDADGINNIAGNTDILKNNAAPVILTPHPKEMSRLTNTTVSSIQKDRIKSARNFAVEYNVYVVLKGAGTVIAHPDGKVFINPTGNSGMASGGMGDVLTGIIAGFICQGYSPGLSANAGVYLHGAAADALAEEKMPFGYLATDLLKIIPEQIGRLMEYRDPETSSLIY